MTNKFVQVQQNVAGGSLPFIIDEPIAKLASEFATAFSKLGNNPLVQTCQVAPDSLGNPGIRVQLTNGYVIVFLMTS